jgi:transcriptional regulator with XRE-family HTH domain
MNTPLDDLAAINGRIARSLRQIRGARALTLDQLAKNAGVSKAMLVQIEQARTNPSVATLCRIANALGVTVSRFVENAEEPPVRLISSSDAVALWRGSKGGAGKLFVGLDTPSLLEVWHWTLVSGEGHDGIAHPAGTHEVLYILEGELTLSSDGSTRHKAAATDVLVFLADRPHRYANEAASGLRFLMAVAEPSPDIDGRQRRSRTRRSMIPRR